MVVKHLSSREARANFADLLGSVYYTNEPVIVEKKGKPVAVIVSPQEYAALTQAQARAWETIQAMRAENAAEDPEAVFAEVTDAVAEVRRSADGR